MLYCISYTPSPVAQSVTCLTADPGVASWIQARSHTLVKIDHEMISMAFLLPSADLRRVILALSPCYILIYVF